MGWVAHTGQPPAPHDLWAVWSPDPLVLLALAVAAWLYHRGRVPGRRPTDGRRAACFAAALVALATALMSPIEPLAGALASVHMVQHVLLILVAAPLLALSAPSSTLLRGSPLVVRRARRAVRRRLGVRSSMLRMPSHPATVWLLHVVTLWFWHSRAAYDAALDDPLVHALEHGTFLVTAVLFWRVVVGARRGRRVPEGLGLLMLFGMAMQSVLLSLLLTFSRQRWYDGYVDSTAPWGLTPLADQQLAGVLMWVPAGAIHVVAALALLASWMHRLGDGDDPADETRPPRRRPEAGSSGVAESRNASDVQAGDGR